MSSPGIDSYGGPVGQATAGHRRVALRLRHTNHERLIDERGAREMAAAVIAAARADGPREVHRATWWTGADIIASQLL
ncbi:MAG: hypothetical protein QOK02_3195 [Mycobacterium sp.]|jgi:hypothetical protein|nr:hypothetical protein [Mycobacterium sp.]